MRQQIPHYGDILRKVERSILSCQTLDQLNSARRFAAIFDKYCESINLDQHVRNVLTSSISNKLEDKWEDLKLEEISNHTTE